LGVYIYTDIPPVATPLSITSSNTLFLSLSFSYPLSYTIRHAALCAGANHSFLGQVSHACRHATAKCVTHGRRYPCASQEQTLEQSSPTSFYLTVSEFCYRLWNRICTISVFFQVPLKVEVHDLGNASSFQNSKGLSTISLAVPNIAALYTVSQ